MIVSINQPAYLPWLGYFHRIALSDIHIVLDHVQFEKNSFTNRNKIRTDRGWCWLTVPVKTKGKFGNLPINHLEIAETSWQRKHWRALQIHYAKAPYFAEHASFFEKLYQRNWQYLKGVMDEITAYLLEAVGIHTKILFSSDMAVEGKKDELVHNLCRHVGATLYISGNLGREYLHEELFQNADIAVVYQDYHHPVYSQCYQGFEPFMAAIDLLFNYGSKSFDILMDGNVKKHDILESG
jgi:hypothetical protein